MTEDVNPSEDPIINGDADTTKNCYPTFGYEDSGNEEAASIDNGTYSGSDHASHMSDYGTSPEPSEAEHDVDSESELDDVFGNDTQ